MIELNNDIKYVVKNMVQDNDYPSLDPNSSWVQGKKELVFESYFIPNTFVYERVQDIVLRNK